MEAAEAAMARMKAGEEEEVRAMRRVMAVAAALHPASRLAVSTVYLQPRVVLEDDNP